MLRVPACVIPSEFASFCFLFVFVTRCIKQPQSKAACCFHTDFQTVHTDEESTEMFQQKTLSTLIFFFLGVLIQYFLHSFLFITGGIKPPGFLICVVMAPVTAGY